MPPRGAFNKLARGCTWTAEEIDAYAHNMIVGPDGQWVTAPSLFGATAEPGGAAAQAQPGNGGDWREPWRKEVERQNRERIERLRRRGRG